MLARSDLLKYQVKAADFMKSQTGAALFLFMGAGKTIMSLTAIADLFKKKQISRVLVVAPLNVAKSVWKQEAAKWKHTRHLNIEIATGSHKNIIDAAKKNSEVLVLNRENFVKLVLFYRDEWPFDMVILDESQSFKNISSKRFRALNRVLRHIKRIVLLTGTPSPNGLIDLWGQIYLLDHGRSLGKTITGFKKRYFNEIKRNDCYIDYQIKPGSDKEIHNKIRHLAISMKGDDYLQLPDKIFIDYKIDLDSQTIELYEKFKRDLICQLDGSPLVATNAAVLSGKLLQWANGAVYRDDKRNFTTIHNAKLEALDEIIESNENILLAYSFISDLERLKKRYPGIKTIKDRNSVDDWNNKKIRLLAGHPASIGHGLNLQKGGSVIVWFGIPYNLEHYLQFNARLHRQGQAEPVRIIHLMANNTMDERARNILKLKHKVENTLLDSLKVELFS